MYCLRLWEKVLDVEPNTIDIEACIAAQPSAEQIDAWIEGDWGAAVAQEVREQWKQKVRDADVIRAELKKFCTGLDELRTLLSHDLLPSCTVEKAILDAGGPVTPEDMLASTAEYYNALKRARFIRNRFTILDLAAELNVP